MSNCSSAVGGTRLERTDQDSIDFYVRNGRMLHAHGAREGLRALVDLFRSRRRSEPEWQVVWPAPEADSRDRP